MTIGDLIKEYRMEHNLSQRQFALKCNVSNGYISMLERGINPKTDEPITPSLHALMSLADAMRLSLTEMLSKIDDVTIDISAFDINITVTSNERHLLKLYRCLDAMDKIKIEERIQTLLEADKYKEKTPSVDEAI